MQKVDVLDVLRLPSIEVVHPALLVLIVVDIQFLEYAEEGARRRPNDHAQVLGLGFSSKRPLIWPGWVWLASALLLLESRVECCMLSTPCSC